MLVREGLNLVPYSGPVPVKALHLVFGAIAMVCAAALVFALGRYGVAVRRYRRNRNTRLVYPGEPGVKPPSQDAVRQLVNSRPMPPRLAWRSLVGWTVALLLALSWIVPSFLGPVSFIIRNIVLQAIPPMGGLGYTLAFWGALFVAGRALYRIIPMLLTYAGERMSYTKAVRRKAWAQAWWDKWVAETKDNLNIWQAYHPAHMAFAQATKAWEDRRTAAANEAAAAAATIKREVPRLVAALQKSFTAVRYQAALENPPITGEAELGKLFKAAFPELPVARDPMLIPMLPHMMDEPLARVIADRYPPGKPLATTFDEAAFLAEHPKPVRPQRPNAVFYSDWEPLESWQIKNGKPCPRGYE
jgi:hypothetical protein